jgi:hypothetical protein
MVWSGNVEWFGGSFAANAAGKWEQTLHSNCISFFVYYRTLVVK